MAFWLDFDEPFIFSLVRAIIKIIETKNHGNGAAGFGCLGKRSTDVISSVTVLARELVGFEVRCFRLAVTNIFSNFLLGTLKRRQALRQCADSNSYTVSTFNCYRLTRFTRLETNL